MNFTVASLLSDCLLFMNNIASVRRVVCSLCKTENYLDDKILARQEHQRNL